MRPEVVVDEQVDDGQRNIGLWHAGVEPHLVQNLLDVLVGLDDVVLVPAVDC